MSGVKNILFIMADQLRADYLSCYGHPRLQTPAIDALARRGVLFSHAYVNATVCGPSRMCYYTGRHMSSHGSTWNGVPLRVGEPTLGGHLRALGMRVALVGKTHMVADRPGLAQLGVGNNSIEGVYAREAGFEPYERDDGLHPDSWLNPELAYNRYLRERGYNEPNPWHTAANSAAGPSGEILSTPPICSMPKVGRFLEKRCDARSFRPIWASSGSLTIISAVLWPFWRAAI